MPVDGGDGLGLLLWMLWLVRVAVGLNAVSGIHAFCCQRCEYVKEGLELGGLKIGGWWLVGEELRAGWRWWWVDEWMGWGDSCAWCILHYDASVSWNCGSHRVLGTH